MAEYGILLWRDNKTNDKTIPPEEYDIFVDLDERIEPTAKTNDTLMKFGTTEKIFAEKGTIDTLANQTKYSSYKTTGLRKRETSESVMPTFIDRCISRLAEASPQESLDLAIERARWDPRRENVGYDYVSNGFYSVRVSHSTILTKKNALQTMYVDRVPMCVGRTHHEGLDRLYSHLLTLNLLDVKLGKIMKSEALKNLTSEVGSEAATLFLIELPKHKLTTQPVTAVEAASNTYASLVELEEQNIGKRTIHLAEGSVGEDIACFVENLSEEIQDVMKDSKINKILTLFGRNSKYIPELKLVAWKVSNIQNTKGTLAKVTDWKDLQRLPGMYRGIFSVLFHPLQEVFETYQSPENFYMVDQPQFKHFDHWQKWWNEIQYKNETVVDNRLRRIYGNVEPRCVMEKCLLHTYLETCGFLYNVIGRWSDLRVRRKLYPVIFRKSKNASVRTSEEDRKKTLENEMKACDMYLEDYYVWENWDEQLLEKVIRVTSIPCAFILLLRYAYDLDMNNIDPDLLESDMNLVIRGKRSLESFLEHYVHPLSNLVKRVNTINTSTTISEIFTLLTKYNLLLLLLSTFGEVEFKYLNTAGFLMFRRYAKDKYFLAHVVPKNKTAPLKGVKMQDILIYFIGYITCEEFSYNYSDKFEGLESEEWTSKWDNLDAENEEWISNNKEKYGEKSEEWEQEKRREHTEMRRQARFRWELIDLLKRLYRDPIFDKRSRSLITISHETIHFSRLNYVEIAMLMATQCRGFSDIVTLCYPIAAPHKSLLVVTIHSEVVAYADVLISLMKRFPNNFQNIYQHVMIEIGPDETRYHTMYAKMTTSERIRYKGLGPMSVKLYPYTLLGVDSRALIVKSDKAKRGSPFFFVKIASAK
uniref:VP2 n=1 Tax=CHeRI orbivirus 3-4 TaxID=2729576 RepID=A0A6M3SLB1_9REOV|nr:VP2 [CHeRI orbivirus 3-4]